MFSTLTMNTTKNTGGRFANQFIRNMAAHFLAEQNNIKMEYSYFNEMKELGISLYVGSLNYETCTKVNDDNFFNLLNKKVNTNIFFEELYCQTSEFAHYLYHYFNTEKMRQNIITSNYYKNRYQKNNDVFLHNKCLIKIKK